LVFVQSTAAAKKASAKDEEEDEEESDKSKSEINDEDDDEGSDEVLHIYPAFDVVACEMLLIWSFHSKGDNAMLVMPL
jgi:hypothetical protein